MDLKHLPTAAEVFAEMDAELDAEARARWQRTALARVVANTVVAYRTEHRLSQAALAAKLGMKRSAISWGRWPRWDRPSAHVPSPPRVRVDLAWLGIGSVE